MDTRVFIFYDTGGDRRSETAGHNGVSRPGEEAPLTQSIRPPRRTGLVRLYDPPRANRHGRRRYGRVNGWPLDVLWWRTSANPPESPSPRAVQLEPDLWIELRLAPEPAPQLVAAPEVADGCRAPLRAPGPAVS